MGLESLRDKLKRDSSEKKSFPRELPVLPEKREELLRKIIEFGLLALIIFSPLPAASVHEWSILVIQLTSLFLTALYFLLAYPPHINPNLSLHLKWPKYFFFGFFLFTLIQMIPLPKFMVQIVSPQAYFLREKFSLRLAETKTLTLSLVPSSTMRAALELLSYVLIGFLIIRTITRRHQIRRMMTVLVAMGVFEAFYGLFELYRKNPRVLFYKKIYSLDSVTGTFINRNHFSGYLELVLPLAIGLIISRVNLFSSRQKRWSERIGHLMEGGLTSLSLLFLSIVVMSLAIILSHSRSGVFLLFLTFWLFLELTVLYFGGSKNLKDWIKNFLKVTFIIITLFALYIGVEATINRFSLDKLSQEGRPFYWQNVAPIVADFPLFGTGLGTFASVYQAYERIGLGGFLSHAHNDYLEYFSELGFLGFILLGGGILFLTVNSFLTWTKRHNPEIKGLALGGIVSTIILLIHSLTDFNLHIPANMFLFSVILSLTFVTVYHRKL